MTNQSEIARIAAGLTEAQSEGLKRKPCPSWWPHGPACMPHSERTGIALKKRGLCVASATSAWPLTPSGIAVRALLEQEKP